MSIRKDINDLTRDEKGRLSATRVGLLLGQWLAVKVIIQNGPAVIDNWDSMLVLFLVLIAPDALRKIVSMKYGGTSTEINYDQTGRTSKTVVKDLSRE